MNYVDLIIVITLIIFALEGYKRPLFSEIFDLMSFLAAFLMSLKYYNLAADYLETTFSLPHSLANVLGFITIWYLIEVLIFVFARFSLKKYNRLLKIPAKDYVSMIPSTLKGLIFVSILLVLTATFPIQPKIKKDVNDSRVGSYILNSTYKLEAPLKNVFGGLANDTLTFLTVKPESNQSIGLGFKNSNFFYDEALEKEMLDLVNQERVSRGLKALAYAPTLRPVGRDHSSDMFKRGYFSHYSPEGEDVADRADRYGINYLIIGENLAYAPTLESAHNGLMNSPGHKANILSPEYHRMAIGVANGAEYGLMITQVFSN